MRTGALVGDSICSLLRQLRFALCILYLHGVPENSYLDTQQAFSQHPDFPSQVCHIQSLKL